MGLRDSRPPRGSQSQGCPGLPAPRLSCRVTAGLPPPPRQSGGLGIPTGLTLPRRVFEKELMSVYWVARIFWSCRSEDSHAPRTNLEEVISLKDPWKSN